MQDMLDRAPASANSDETATPVSYLTLELAKQVFGIEVARVLRIHDELQIARLPQAPHGIEGVVDIDGESLAIADLRGPLGLHGDDGTDAKRLVVLQLGNPPRAIGVVADRVLDVVAIRPDEIEALPAGSSEGGPVTGIARVAGRIVMLLAIEKVVGAVTAGPFDFD